MGEPTVIFEDGKILAMRKPEAYLSQADASSRPDILSFSKDHIKRNRKKEGNVYLALCHRLDYAVGGVMVFAKSTKIGRAHV
jgi:23S rRNA-/tRNA-specific pseudouridylate synthase